MSSEEMTLSEAAVPEASIADPSGTWMSPTGETLVLTGKGMDGSGYSITGPFGASSGLVGQSWGYAIALIGYDNDKGALVSWTGKFENTTKTMTTQVARQDVNGGPLTTSTITYSRT
jgi:hypothetical protein